MGSLSAIKTCKFGLMSSLLFIITSIQVSCFQYEVGGEKGWVKPHGRTFETYNHWAQKHRFHVGDSLYFRYTNDSVLQVCREDYEDCTVHNAVSKFENSRTIFIFYRPGFFYFISGKPGHCQAGQKMVIRVMAQYSVHCPTISSPAPSPSPEGPDGVDNKGGLGWTTDSWGAATLANSTEVLSSVTTYVLNMFMGVVIVLYVFMD